MVRGVVRGAHRAVSTRHNASRLLVKVQARSAGGQADRVRLRRAGLFCLVARGARGAVRARREPPRRVEGEAFNAGADEVGGRVAGRYHVRVKGARLRALAAGLAPRLGVEARAVYARGSVLQAASGNVCGGWSEIGNGSCDSPQGTKGAKRGAFRRRHGEGARKSFELLHTKTGLNEWVFWGERTHVWTCNSGSGTLRGCLDFRARRSPSVERGSGQAAW